MARKHTELAKSRSLRYVATTIDLIPKGYTIYDVDSVPSTVDPEKEFIRVTEGASTSYYRIDAKRPSEYNASTAVDGLMMGEIGISIADGYEALFAHSYDPSTSSNAASDLMVYRPVTNMIETGTASQYATTAQAVSAFVVPEYIEDVGSAAPSITMTENTVYRCTSSGVTSMTLNISNMVSGPKTRESVVYFHTGSSDFSLTLSGSDQDTLVFGSTSLKADTTYAVSVKDNAVVIARDTELTEGTVKSVGTGEGLMGGPITSTGTISLAQATDSTLGGVKLGYSGSGRNYALQLDSNGKGYVNVPWEEANNATLTIQENGTTIDTFTANASVDKTIDITVPTKTSDIENDSGFITEDDIKDATEVTAAALNDLDARTNALETLVDGGDYIEVQTLKVTRELDAGLAEVAFSGDYNDLINKPVAEYTTVEGSVVSLNMAEYVSYRCTDSGVTSLTLDVTDMVTGPKTGESVVYFHTGDNPTLTITGKDSDTLIYGLEALEADKNYAISVKDNAIIISSYTESADGTVTRIATGVGLNGGPITTTGEISLKTASDGEIGGIRTGWSGTGKNYAVQLDENDKAFVSVPWENTTYDVNDATFKISANGSNASDTLFTANVDTDVTGINFINGNCTTASVTAASGNTPATAKFDHNTSGASAGTYGPTADVTGSDSATIKIPKITVDTYGHITSIEEKTYTSVDHTYTVNDGKLTIKAGDGTTSSTAAEFTANQSTNSTITLIGGSDITLTADGTNNTITVAHDDIETSSQVSTAGLKKITTDGRGHIVTTADAGSSDITGALGYTPYDATNPSGYTANTGTVTKVTAGTGLTGGDITTTGTIALDVAKSTAIGGIKIGYTNTTGKYALELDNSGKAYVSIPWSSEITTGTTSGTINVNGSDVAVNGWSSKADLASPEFTGTPTAPTATSGTNNTQIATTAFVMEAFKANDAMVFKGTIGTGGTVTSLPATHDAGWTYKVITAGTYAGQVCEVGDMIVCISDGTSASDSDWSVIQTNVDGAVTGPASSTANHIATFDGTSGKVIKDSGYTIATSVPANAVFTDQNVNQTVASDNAEHPILVKNNANSTSETSQGTKFGAAVTVNPSTGNVSATKFNGYVLAGASEKSVDTSISLGSSSLNLPTSKAVNDFVVPAYETESSSTPSITVSENTVYKCTSAGVTSMTLNIANMVSGPKTRESVVYFHTGSNPTLSITNKSSDTVVFGSETLEANKDYAISVKDNSVVISTYIEPAQGTVKRVNTGAGLNGGPITESGEISLKTASANEIGGVKTGYTQNAKNYPVVLDSNSNAYVNVPWADVYNATLTVQKNGTTVDTFTANASADKTIDITVPTKTSDIENDSGFITEEDIKDATEVTAAALNELDARTNALETLVDGGDYIEVQTLKVTRELDAGLAEVAFSGDYNDLINKPVAEYTTVEGSTVSVAMSENTAYRCTDSGVTSLTLDVTDMVEGPKTSESLVYFHTGANPSLTITGTDSDTLVYGSDTLEGDKDYAISVKDNAIIISTYTENASGTVRQVNTGEGLIGGPITTTGSISLAKATDSTLGGFKTGWSGTGKNYAVQLDENDKAFVNVPWENNTYTVNDGVFKIAGNNNTAVSTLFTANGTDATGIKFVDGNKVGVTVTGANGSTPASVKLDHSTSGVTANTYGPAADVTGTNNTTIKVPQFTVDSYGHITSVTERTYTSVDHTYTVNDSKLKISANGTDVSNTLFTTNASSDTTAINFINGNCTTASVTAASGSTPATAKFDHNTSGASAGTYGPTADVTGSNNATIKVPKITVDTYGHITSIEEKTYTSVDHTYDIPTVNDGSFNVKSSDGTTATTVSTFTANQSGTIDLTLIGGTDVTLSANTTNKTITINHSDVETSSQVTTAGLKKITTDGRGHIVTTAAAGSSDITGALGYTPYDATNPSGYTTNTGTVTKVTAGTGLTGGDVTTTGTIALDVAKTDTIGGVKVAGTRSSTITTTQGGTNGANYGLERDSNNKAFVNIPWSTAITSGTTAGTITVNGSAVSVGGWANKADLASPAFTGTPTAPTATAGTSTTQIATTAFVMEAFKSNDAMIFKGTIGTGGTVTTLPSTHDAGWTYKVITAGTYAGQICEVGDMIICISDGTSASDADWAVVQTNVDGAVTGPSSSTANHIATFDGTSGKVIKDSGYTIATSVPANAVFTDKYVDQTAITDNAEHPILVKNGANSTSETSQSAKFGASVTVNPSTGNITATKFNGYVLAAASAKSVDASISLGSSSANLPTSKAVNDFVVPAYSTESSSTPSITVAENTVYRCTSAGVTSMTLNIANMVTGPKTRESVVYFHTGTNPSLTISGTDSNTMVFGSQTLEANKDYAISVKDNSVVISTYVEPAQGTVKQVSTGAGLIGGPITSTGEISLAQAANNSIGGVKLGYSESGKNYALQVDSNGKAFVNVPWENSTYTVNNGTFKISANGSAAVSTLFTANGTDATAINFINGNKISATVTAASGSTPASVKLDHDTSGVTANTYGPAADVTGSNNATIKVPQITVDAYGHITSVTERTYTSVDHTYTVNDGTFTIKSSIDNTSSDISDFTANQSSADDFTLVQGDGISFTNGTRSITVAHKDTSSQASSTNSGRTYIQSISLDTYGHVTSLSTATETVTDTWNANTSTVAGYVAAPGTSGTNKVWRTDSNANPYWGVLSDSNLTNDRYVRYDTGSQNLSSTQQSNARTNIGASAYPSYVTNTSATTVSINPVAENTIYRYTNTSGVTAVSLNVTSLMTTPSPYESIVYFKTGSSDVTMTLTGTSSSTPIFGSTTLKANKDYAVSVKDASVVISSYTEGAQGTVKSVATGVGLNGGPITDSGEISLKAASTNEIGGVKVAGARGSAITTTQGGTGGVNYGLERDSNNKAFVNIPYTLAAASEKGVDTSITLGTTSTNLPTSKAVNDFVVPSYDSTTYTGSTVSITMTENTIYRCTNAGVTSMTLNMANMVSGPKTRESVVYFHTGSNPTLSFTNTNSNTMVFGNTTLEADKDYAICVKDNAIIISTYSEQTGVTEISTGVGLNGGPITDTGQISLKHATNNELGGVKTGYTTSEANRNYKLQLDGSDNAYTNVPSELFVVTCTGDSSSGMTTSASATEIYTAVTAGKLVICKWGDEILMCEHADANLIEFVGFTGFGAGAHPIKTEILIFGTMAGISRVTMQEQLIGSGTGQNIKTINSQSILGSGNIDLATESEMEDASEVAAAALNDLNARLQAIETRLANMDYLEAQTINVTRELTAANLSAVAYSGSYNDLTDISAQGKVKEYTLQVLSGTNYTGLYVNGTSTLVNKNDLVSGEICKINVTSYSSTDVRLANSQTTHIQDGEGSLPVGSLAQYDSISAWWNGSNFIALANSGWDTRGTSLGQVTTTVTSNVANVELLGHHRTYAFATVTADTTVNFTCPASNAGENYLSLTNTTNSDVTITIGTINGKTIPSQITVYAPEGGIVVEANSRVELSIIIFTNMAFITASDKLVALS